MNSESDTSPHAGHENSSANAALTWSKKLINAPGLPRQYWHLEDDALCIALQKHKPNQSNTSLCK